MPLAKVTVRESPSSLQSFTKPGTRRLWMAPTSRMASHTTSPGRPIRIYLWIEAMGVLLRWIFVLHPWYPDRDHASRRVGASPYRLVDPPLDTARIQTVVVVVPPAVAAAVAHVGDQHFTLSNTGTAHQKDATAGDSRADMAGYRPERPGFVHDSSHRGDPDAARCLPHRNVRRRIS